MTSDKTDDAAIRQEAARVMAVRREIARRNRAEKNLLLFVVLCLIWPAAYVYLWGWLKAILAVVAYLVVTAFASIDQATTVSLVFAGAGLIVGVSQILLARSTAQPAP
jgi:fatty acid desaturase